MSESNLEDRSAIHDLFTRYCCALDNGEVEAVVDCFTVDAILKSPVIDVSGHDEIRSFASRFAAQRASPKPLKLSARHSGTLRRYVRLRRPKSAPADRHWRSRGFR
jgi:hypothetical protein